MGTHTEPGSGTGTGRTRPRRRDRRGRGLRGPLAPASVPLARSRAERFDELVSEAVQRLERRWSTQLEEVEFAVADVPPPDSESWSAEPVPLEARASDRTELGALIHEVLVEEVATLLGIEPENVDPRDDDGEE